MTILAAIDLSSTAESVLDSLPRLVNKNEAITLLHVAEPDPDFVGFDTGPNVVKEQLAQEFSEQKEQLEEYASRLRANGFHVETSQIRGAYAESIMRFADDLDARIIVLGNRRHGTLYDILVGSVAEAVIRNANQPVLLVPNNVE